MSSTTAECTIEVLEEVFATHGFPRLVVSDNGPQFTAVTFENFLKRNRISHRKSPPYHPATNGLAENMVKNVKQWLKKQGRVTNINSALAAFLRTYRNVPHTSTGKTPAEIIFGRVPRTHLSMVVPSMVDQMKDRLEQPENSTPRMFVQGDRAWVRDYRPTAGKWQRGIVHSCLGSLSYNVELEGGHQRKVHMDHLIRQGSRCVPASLEPVPVLTDDEPSLEPESGMAPPPDSSRPQPLNTSEPSEFDTINTPQEEPICRRSSRTIRAPERLTEQL